MRITRGPVDVAGLAFDPATQAELDAHVAAADPHTGYQKESEKAAASGYAGLDANVFVPSAQLARYRAAAVAVGPSDATEVTLINQTIPGGLMGTTGILRCTAGGDFMNSSGSHAWTFRVYAGGVKIYDSGISLSAQATRRPFFAQMSYANRNSAAANQLAGFIDMGTQTAPTTGIGAIVAGATGSTPSAFASDLQTIDTSADWIFKVTMQLDASLSTLDMRISSVLLEVL